MPATMKKKILTCALMLAVLMPAAWAVTPIAGFTAVPAAVQTPVSLTLDIQEVTGAVWYDVYEGEAGAERPLARIAASSLAFDASATAKLTVGNDGSLKADTPYRLVVAARDGAENNLAGVAVRTRTGSWDGTYRWTNPTGADNNGRRASLEIMVRSRSLRMAGSVPRQELFLRTPDGNEVQALVMSPDVYSPGVSYPVDGADAQSQAIREFLFLFNRTRHVPQAWMVESVRMEGTAMDIRYVLTAGDRTVGVSARYELAVDGEGRSVLRLSHVGDGLAKNAVFSNPEAGSSGIFVLLKD